MVLGRSRKPPIRVVARSGVFLDRLALDRRPGPTVATVNIIPDDRLDDFVAQMTDQPSHLRCCLGLMLYAGLRIGETGKLAWCDLVHNGATLNAIRLESSMTKTKQARDVPITRPLADLLLECWATFPLNSEISPATFATAAKRNARPTSPRTAQRVCHRIRTALGLQRLTPHTLRHTFATRLLSVSNVAAVQMALGHARIGTTQRYVHVNNDQLAQAMEKI